MKGSMNQTPSALVTQVIDVLKTVIHPDLKKDLYTLGMVQDLEAHGNQVQLRVVLSTPSSPHQESLQKEVEKKLSQISGIQNVQVRMDFQVKPANRHLSHQGGARQAGVSAIEGVTHVIAVSSGKGGVGKSTVAVNLATSLKALGAKVGLMDADVYGPNVPTMMGVTERPQLIQDPKRGELFIPPESHGVKIMSMGFLIDPDQPLVWRGPMLHSVISQFCHQVQWGELDYLVVDMPPGTGDVQLSLAQMVPVTGAVLVTTPQEVSIQDVRKAHAMFDKVRIPMIGIVENMSYFQPEPNGPRYEIFGSGGGKALSQKFHTELLAQFPIEMKIRAGGDEGTPITVRDPASPVSLAYRALAQRVTQIISMMVAEGIDPNEIVQIGKF